MVRNSALIWNAVAGNASFLALLPCLADKLGSVSDKNSVMMMDVQAGSQDTTIDRTTRYAQVHARSLILVPKYLVE